MKKLWIPLVVFIFFAPVAFAGLDVLLTAPEIEGYQTTFYNELSDFPDFDTVDWWNQQTYGMPDVEDLEDYDCVVCWSNYQFSNPTQMGDTLAEYVDEGGRVVLAPFCWNSSWAIGGAIVTDGYCPFTGSSGDHYSNASWELDDPDEPDHPFLDDVDSLTCGFRDYVTLASWGNLVTHYVGDNEEAVAYNDDHTVAGLNAYPGQLGSSYQWSGDFSQAMRNVIVWLCPTSDIQPTSLGTLKAMFK